MLNATPALGGELVGDCAGIADRPGEPVELRDHERVAGPARLKRFPERGTIPVRAGEAVIELDVLGHDVGDTSGRVKRPPGLMELFSSTIARRPRCPTVMLV